MSAHSIPANPIRPSREGNRSDGLAETIPSAVAASIAAWPDAEAVVEPDRRVTYAELGERVAISTRAMIAAGVEPGDRVGIWAPNGLGWIAAALGAQCAGAAIVPINTRFKGAEAAYVLAASKAKVLITTLGLLDTDPFGMLSSAETVTAAEASRSRLRAREVSVARMIDLAVERRRMAGVLQRDPVMLRFLQDHEPFRRAMERVNRVLMAGASVPRARAQAATLPAAISGAVIHPLALDLDDETLRSELLRQVRKLLPLGGRRGTRHR